MSWLSTNIISVAEDNFRVSLLCVAKLGAEFWTPLLLTLSSHARAWAGLGWAGLQPHLGWAGWPAASG